MPPQYSHSTPFKGLVPYSEEDAEFFFGRERIRDDIIAYLETWRLTLLYGASGVGKSSVLHAGVVPTVRSLSRQSLDEGQRGTPEFSIVIFNSWRDDPVGGLAGRIHEHLVDVMGEDIPPLVGAPSLVGALDQWAASTDCQLYIILDQFEEYFQYHANEDGSGSFAKEFPRALAKQNQRFKFLISIREDAVGKLDMFTGRVPKLFEHILRVHPLSVEEARNAIEGPIEQYNLLMRSPAVTIEPELLDVVLQSVQGTDVIESRRGPGRTAGGIDATILQQVMIRLWQEDVDPNGSGSLRLETFERLGRAKNIVSTHFSSAMSNLSAADQKIAAIVFRYLVTPSGTKIAQTAKDLSDYSGLPENSVGSVLERLTAPDVRILRAISAPPDQPDEKRYEIFHDVLSGPINEWWGRYENDERVERVRLEGIREQAVVRARYSRRVAVLLSVALLLVSALAVYAFDQKSKAVDTAARELKAKQGEEAAKKEALAWAEREAMANKEARDKTALAEERAAETAKANRLAVTNLALAKAAEAKADDRARIANAALTAAETARKTDSLQRTAFRLSRRKEKREAAITEIEKVLAVYNASKDPGDRLAAIDTLLNIGEVYTDLGNETDATKSFKLAFAKSQNRLERASTLTSVGDIYQEIVPNRAPAYDPLSPTSWSPYAIEFQPKERAISYYESALDVYDELRAELAAGTKIGNPAINDRDVDLLQAGIWVSLGLAKTELRNKRPDFGQATSSANQQQESFNEALRDIERGIYLYDLAGNHQGKGYALFALAEAKMRRGGISPENRKVVMEILRSSLAEYQTSSSLKGKIPVLKRMARVTLQPKEALDSMNEVVRIYTEFNDKPGTASALVELAEVLGQQPLDFGDVKARAARDNQKIQLYMEAADLYEKSDWFDKGAEALMTVSDLYSYESRFNARPVLERAAELYGKQERWGPQLSALRNLIGLSVSGPKPETKTYLNQMNEIAERRTKPEEKAAALERLGQAYIMVKDFEKADAVVKNALEQYRLAKDSYNQISILYRTASVYLERAQPDKAIEYLQQALSMGEKNWEGTLYSSLGEAYSRKSDPTKAIDFYVRAVQVFDGSKETYLQARSLLELGKLYSQESKFDLGVAALNKVIELNRSTDSYWEGGNAIMNLGALYEKKGDVKSAIDSYLRAVQLYEDKKAPNYYEVDPLLKISDVYAKIGDTKLAEEYKLRAKKLQTPIAQPTP